MSTEGMIVAEVLMSSLDSITEDISMRDVMDSLHAEILPSA
jgi:hypothetical protein